MNSTDKGKAMEQSLDSIAAPIKEKKLMIYRLLNYIQPSVF
jgi:hypothetical protein